MLSTTADMDCPLFRSVMVQPEGLKPRESVTAGSAALRLAGLWPERGAAASGPTVAVQVNVSPELLRHWGVVDVVARDITDAVDDISDEDA